MPIFKNIRDHQRFKNGMLHYLNAKTTISLSQSNPNDYEKPEEQLVDIVCYSLMPNHFHFLIKQNIDNGIMNYIRKLTNSYAKYFNTKYDRKGPLFEGKFNAVRVESNEQLLHLSRYIHLNPLIGYVTKDLNSYKWSSYPEYLGFSNQKLCSKSVILDQFKSIDAYEKFVIDQVEYSKKLSEIKHLLLEEI